MAPPGVQTHILSCTVPYGEREKLPASAHLVPQFSFPQIPSYNWNFYTTHLRGRPFVTTL